MPSLWVARSYVTNSFQTRKVAPALLEDTITPWLGPLAPWTRHIVIDNDERARRWIAVCIAVSMFLHLALLLIPITQRMGQPASSQSVQGPLTVRLANPAPRARPPDAVLQSPSAPRPPRRRQIIAMRRPTSSGKPVFTVPPPPIEPAPETTAQPKPQADDFTAHLEARRTARQAAESEAAQENATAAAASGGPSVNDRIMANINRNSRAHKTDDTGGVFEITRIGVREGEFKFNGWHPGTGEKTQESQTVDAGVGGNVRLAIVKGVVKVIRKYKTGDFEFESRRMGRAVTMSARPADNAALEAFLMKELFGEDSQTGTR